MEYGYKKLIAWQKADELAFQIYMVSKDFPKEEIYGITAQVRRASLSVALNIAEGYGRDGSKEFKRFVSISLGSLAEVDAILNFCLKLGYLTSEDFNRLKLLRHETGQLLWKFYKSLGGEISYGIIRDSE